MVEETYPRICCSRYGSPWELVVKPTSEKAENRVRFCHSSSAWILPALIFVVSNLCKCLKEKTTYLLCTAMGCLGVSALIHLVKELWLRGNSMSDMTVSVNFDPRNHMFHILVIVDYEKYETWGVRTPEVNLSVEDSFLCHSANTRGKMESDGSSYSSVVELLGSIQKSECLGNNDHKRLVQEIRLLEPFGAWAMALAVGSDGILALALR
ncbi:hypothetical protein RHSIM_Rhsim12G0055800 [Rhododendron simsii]|uniref:Uncharacterized protein n=1 Tax=Rhododendron simsii TaxID=118357 RepID=A0A834G768_RHOSS|nr:hypothetical protein RHSIM_Rhsim12G0055800 [Rhododendron simsii]